MAQLTEVQTKSLGHIASMETENETIYKAILPPLLIQEG